MLEKLYNKVSDNFLLWFLLNLQSFSNHQAFAQEMRETLCLTCIRFEDQIQLHFRGEAIQMKNWTDEQKLTNDLLLHNSLHELYTRITQLAIVCLRRKIPLIIENPYSTQHYLARYWGIKAKVIDKDRTVRGDYYKKPTQYWFINCEPQQNMILEAYTINNRKTINNIHNSTERSLIS